MLPHFPHSRQSDTTYNRTGAPLAKPGSSHGKDFTFESRPLTPGPAHATYCPAFSHGRLEKELSQLAVERNSDVNVNGIAGINGRANPVSLAPYPPPSQARRCAAPTPPTASPEVAARIDESSISTVEARLGRPVCSEFRRCIHEYICKRGLVG